MAKLTYRQNWLQRILQFFPASTIGATLFSKFLHNVDPLFMRISKGRLSIPRFLTGLPIVLLTSKGAKSGQLRTLPVIGIPDDDNIALIASNWGQTHNPAWYYNLKTNPAAELKFGDHSGTYIAHEVTNPKDYQRLWKKANEVYIEFEKYQQRTTNRKIPIILLKGELS